jgi:hypothetical protein
MRFLVIVSEQIYGMGRPFGQQRYCCWRIEERKKHMQMAILGIDLCKIASSALIAGGRRVPG